MIKVCVPESKIENVSVEYGKYYVRYFSGRQKVYTNPPKSVMDFIKKTPSKEHYKTDLTDFGGKEYEWDLYRNYQEV